MSTEDVLGGGLAGAGTGASVGAFGGPTGALIGGGLGFLGGSALGYFGGKKKEKARKAAQQAVEQSRIQLEQLAAQQRAQRETDLKEALSYFSPVQAEMGRLYGRGGGGGTAAPTWRPTPPSSASLRSIETMMAPTPRGGIR